MAAPDYDWKPIKAAACVYCGSRNDLTDEHIVPLNLGGKTKIPNGSCKKCAEVTKKFEQTVARTMFGAFRIKMNAPTRHPKDRPKQIEFVTIINGTRTKKALEPSAHPGSYALPAFEIPQIVTRDTAQAPHINDIWTWPAPDEIDKVFSPLLPKGAQGIIGAVNVNAFVRFLAKMSHCNCAAMYGSESFIPLLTSLIVGNSTEFADYIGGSTVPSAVRTGNLTPTLVNSIVRVHSTFYFKVTIQMFPSQGGPMYDIYTGVCVDQKTPFETYLPALSGTGDRVVDYPIPSEPWPPKSV